MLIVVVLCLSLGVFLLRNRSAVSFQGTDLFNVFICESNLEGTFRFETGLCTIQK